MSPQRPSSRSSKAGEHRRCTPTSVVGSLGFLAVFALCCVLYTDIKVEVTGATKVRLISANIYRSQDREVWTPQTNALRLNEDLFPSSDVHSYVNTDTEISSQPLSAKTLPQVDIALAEAINRQIQPPMSKKFDCSKLFKGNIKETERAMEFQRSVRYTPPSYSSLMQATTNCAAFRAARGYATHSSREEAEFPLAFSIVMHKSVEQFERLLRAIYRPVNYYCVHVDKKAKPSIHNAVKAITRCFPNVFLASKLEPVVYAGYTRLQADINCMQDLYDGYSDWKYFLNVVGTEFPLMPNSHLVYILKLYNGTNIIERHMKTISPWTYERKFKTVFTKNTRTGRLKKESDQNLPPPFNLNITKCSAFGAFSRAFIGYVLHDSVAKAFYDWSKTTYSPDELFWGTLNNLHKNTQLASPGGDLSDEDNHMARAVMWKSPKCHGKNVHIICNFGAGDLPWLRGSYQLFANKFDLSVDQVVYECMEELLAKRSAEQLPHKLKPFTTYLRHARGDTE